MFCDMKFPFSAGHTVAMTGEAADSAVQAAVDRGLAKYRLDATREVETILDAALRVAERMAPAAPRVADIIAEAGTSNQAFYRYFAGKDDLMTAVRQRGTVRLQAYLEHQIAKQTNSQRQIEAWIRGVLTQAIDRRAARQSAAVNLQLAHRHQAEDVALTGGLQALLLDPLVASGSREPERDAAAIFETVFGTLRRHLAQSTAPTAADTDHLVAFCLRAGTVPARRRATPAKA
jgi:AcrR family transcriptional regulator